VRDPAVALGVLTRLRLRGFGLSLDDYGTGFSSMQQLARIPFTELKIDRSFVRGVHERDALRVMLRSAVEMASELGLVTVAEGVESRAELGILESCGCTLVQGWLFAKAMPALELTQWLRTRSNGIPPNTA
jgi:EAL domain-containing protein (putative c-di-GMP-specific phosphodiesterase class I)